MALPSSGNITLSAIEQETSSTSLVGASNSAGFALPTAMTEFYGYSSFTPPSPSGSYASFRVSDQRAVFNISLSNCQPSSFWELLVFPYPGSGTEDLYPSGWDGDGGFNGFVNIFGNGGDTRVTYGGAFWWPATRGNILEIHCRGTNGQRYVFSNRVINYGWDRTDFW